MRELLYAVYATNIIALIIATITDLRTREIYTWVFPLSFGISTIFNVIYIYNYGNYMDVIMLVAGGLIFGIASFVMAKKDKMGGGDVIMLACIGGSLGFIRTAEALLISCIAGFLWMLIKKERSVPYAPLFLIGFAADLIVGFAVGYIN